MLDAETKARIDSARDVLVGKVPDPKSQVEQITIALIYKFMDDMDRQSEELGGVTTFFSGEFIKYAWSRLLDKSLGGHERLMLYAEGIAVMDRNPNIPQLFRDIFKGAFLPYRDPETLNLFLKEINGFSYDHSERLGDAFEYLLSVLGSQGEAGQFRTPRHIIDFIVRIVDPQKHETIADPACGTAGFLISAYKHILAQNSDERPGDKLSGDERARLMDNFSGYDISPDMVRLSRANLYLHGFANPRIHEYDTLTSEERWDERYDVIMANPPFMSPKGGIRPHNRFSIKATRSEVLFVDYIAEHLHVNGRAGVIVPEGIIFQSQNAYKALRKMLVEGYLWCVVSLPGGVFNPYSGVKTSILLLDKGLAKRTDEILFVKVAADGFDLGAQRRPVERNDLPEAERAIAAWKAGQQPAAGSLAHAVSRQRILESADCGLSGDRYRDNGLQISTKWPMESLESLCKVFADGDWVESKDQSESGIRLIQTGNVGVGEYLDKGHKARFVTEETCQRLNCSEVLPGDILISRLPDPVGRACMVPPIRTPMITAVDCTIVRFDEAKVVPDFFVFLSTTPQYFQHLASFLTGASRQRISRANLGKIEIPLPPLDVQRQIVAELDGYRKIIAGARQVIANYKPTIRIDPSWPRVLVGDVCELVRGSSPRPKSDPRFYGGDVPRLMVADVTRDGMYVTPSIDFLTQEGSQHSRLMRAGELVMAVSGNPGLASILQVDAYIHDGFVGFRNLSKAIVPEFLYFVLGFLKESNDAQSIGAVFRNLTTDQIKALEVPAPPVSVQESVVRDLMAERVLIDANRKLVALFEQKIQDKLAEIWGEAGETA